MKALTYDPKVHPIERLRYVARAGDVPLQPLVRESAAALAAFADDPMALLTSCRRLLARRPGCGPLVWLAARMLTGPDPRDEAWTAVEEFERDPTHGELQHALPEGGRVLVLGAPDTVGRALRSRPDLHVFLVGSSSVGPAYGYELLDGGSVVIDVPESGVGPAAAEVDVVLLESECLGPDAALVAPGAHAAAACAHRADTAVWLVSGVGRVLPGRMWDELLGRLDLDEPWDRDTEVLELADNIDHVVTPVGLRTPAEATRRIDCPVAPELFRTDR